MRPTSDLPMTDQVRHGQLRASNPWANGARFAVATILTVALSAVAVGAFAVWSLVGSINTVELPDAEPVDIASGTIDGPLTVLVVGTDSRAGQSIDDGEEGNLNDVNLLLHISADHQSATVVSFPRDLMLPIPSCPGPNGEPDYYSAMSEQQLNSTLNSGGLPCVAATLSELTGLDIPYAGEISFDGVIAMSNAVGGVEVCLAQPIVDPKTDLDLPAGQITLEGTEALQFLRTRYGVGDGGDTSRISNQQVFMSALMRKLKSAETLSDPVKVYGLAKAALSNMVLSSNMQSMPFLQAAAGTMQDIELENITFVQYPTARHPYAEGRLVALEPQASALNEALISGTPITVGGTGEGVVTEDQVGSADAGGVADASGVDASDAGAGAGADSTSDASGDATAADATADSSTSVDAAVTADASAAADASVTAEASATASGDGITGQNAATVTCSQGRTVL
ncbi:LCP family protein [Leucobacter japonicus]|uniref:LCP family protein n=1 Tax=Leucobacter japonicus TaxID=1461259 RepID=UPI00094965AB|nr:LCP family protein [Leucobacter japonicus]